VPPGVKDAGLTPTTRLQPAIDWAIVDSFVTSTQLARRSPTILLILIQPALAGLLA
jgi:hypothetical protein